MVFSIILLPEEMISGDVGEKATGSRGAQMRCRSELMRLGGCGLITTPRAPARSSAGDRDQNLHYRAVAIRSDSAFRTTVVT
jgi:hypothetical protein